MKTPRSISRRNFLTGSTVLLTGPVWKLFDNLLPEFNPDPIIDIHQHTDYHGRTNKQLLAHQRAMRISTTVLLPSWRPDDALSGNEWLESGWKRWKTTGNEVCYQFAQKYPGEFLFGANGVPGQPDMIRRIEKYLKLGAPIIGEMKYGVACDSPEMQKIYELAQVYEVPVLMHWQYQRYNFGFERFHKMLEKYPKVNFIGHAQTWWVNIDKDHEDQNNLYPGGKVNRGGLTDQLLSDYPNMYADLSAGSGLNALTRDEKHAKGFLDRHQDKLMYGSDCGDPVGRMPECRGAEAIAAIRRLSVNKEIERKVLYENSKQLLRL